MKKLAVALLVTVCAVWAQAPFDANMTGGKIHYGGERFEKAAALFATAVEQRPNNYDAHLWLAETYAKLQKKIEAAKEFVKVLELDSLNFDKFDNFRDSQGRPEGKEYAQLTLFFASALSLKDEKMDDALVFIKAALRLEPTNTDNLLQLTRVYLKMGKLDEVKKIAADMLAANPNAPDVYYFFGRYYYANNQWDSAKVDFTKWLGLLSQRFEAARDTAMQLWNLKSEARLLGVLATLDSLRMNKDKYHAFLVDSLKVPKDPEQYNHATRLIYNLFDSWRKLVPGYGEAGRYAFEKLDMEYAEQMYSQAFKLDPENGDAIYNLGIVKYNRSKYDEAKELLAKATVFFPNDDQAFTLLGHVYLLLAEELLKKGQNDDGNKEIDSAVKALEKAVELNPKNGDAYRFLGIAYAHKGDIKKAEEYLKKGQELMKESAPK
jgi:tetratricopeptide (TPR) repeat protein